MLLMLISHTTEILFKQDSKHELLKDNFKCTANFVY